MDSDMSLQETFVHNIVVISGIRDCGRTVDIKKNGRGAHGILYIWSGETTFYLENGKTVKASDAQVVYLPKSARYKMQYTANSTTFVVVNFDLLEQGKKPFDIDDVTVVARDDSVRSIANIMAKFEVCGAVRGAVGEYRRKELLYRLLSVIDNSSANVENHRYPQIVKGVMLLKQSYLESLPIETFAKESSVSVSTFRQLFHKQYGMSPLQYRNRLRIERAKQLLEYDQCTVAEAAYASGFENIGYFCRYYKKVTGKTPKKGTDREEKEHSGIPPLVSGGG